MLDLDLITQPSWSILVLQIVSRDGQDCVNERRAYMFRAIAPMTYSCHTVVATLRILNRMYRLSILKRESGLIAICVECAV